MKDFEPAMPFSGRDAEEYDSLTLRGDEDDATEFLARLAGTGAALELAIGTGRIGLRLAARGVRVDGIDLSPAMVAQLRAKPGGEELAVTIGNFADVPVDGSYRLIYVVFNTLFNLLSQDEQVRCFENVAAHLDPDGVFVVEAIGPSFLSHLRHDQYVEVEGIAVDSVRLDVLRHDGATQMIEESHISMSAQGLRFTPIVQRYAWPAELDLMARIAGLRLHERWGGWRGEPYTSTSELHVSVYGR
jgi:SAM-dependent methyltransferase